MPYEPAILASTPRPLGIAGEMLKILFICFEIQKLWLLDLEKFHWNDLYLVNKGTAMELASLQ